MTTRRPTLEDVARAARVSRSTVSRVVNHDPRVEPEARDRVRRAVAELGYRPNAAARTLAGGRADVVQLVVIDDDPSAFGTNPYYGRVVTGVLEAVAGTDVTLRVRVLADTHTARVVDEVAADTLGTLLVNVPAEQGGRLHRRDEGRVVALGPSAPRVPHADPDNVAGATAAVRHLYESGRRRIAAVHGPAWSPCGLGRRAGYEAAVDGYGLRPRGVDGDFCRVAGVEGTQRLLAAHADLDAIFAACDSTAAGVLQALAAAGRRVPDDIAVVGFDDSVLAAAGTPPLTTLHHPVERIARTATQALLHGEARPEWSRIFPTDLRVRASSTG